MRAICFAFVISWIAVWPYAAHAQSNSAHELSLAKSVVSRYCDAWSLVNAAERKLAIAEVWAERGEYLDSQPTRVTGREALVAEIVKFQQQFPGAQFRCSAVRAHQGFVGYSWSMVMPDGTERLQGMDFGEIDPAGRFIRIVSFFDMPEPAQ